MIDDSYEFPRIHKQIQGRISLFMVCKQMMMDLFELCFPSLMLEITLQEIQAYKYFTSSFKKTLQKVQRKSLFLKIKNSNHPKTRFQFGEGVYNNDLL